MDALSRDALYSLLSGLLSSAPALAALNLRQALGPLGSSLLPLATPLELMSRCCRRAPPPPPCAEAPLPLHAAKERIRHEWTLFS